MQPPAPPPPPFPPLYVPGPPLPPAKRGYGIVVMVGAVVWGLGAIVGFVLVYALVLAIYVMVAGEPTGSGSGSGVEPWAPLTASAVVLVLVAVGVAAATVLDVVCAVMSVRRLVGRIGDAIVPWTVLVSIGLAWLSVVAAVVLVVIAVQVRNEDLSVVAGVVLMAIPYAVLPLCRITQLVAGIIRTSMGERPRGG